MQAKQSKAKKNESFNLGQPSSAAAAMLLTSQAGCGRASSRWVEGNAGGRGGFPRGTLVMMLDLEIMNDVIPANETIPDWRQTEVTT